MTEREAWLLLVNATGRMGEMLASVGYAKGGTVTVGIVDWWGNEVEL